MKIKRFSPKQKRVMCWWGPKSTDRHYDAIICDGAVRSGKTLCMGLSFVCWAMASFKGQQFAFCGKSVVSLRRNLLQELTPLLQELGFQCREKRSENLLSIRRGGRENRFYLMGGKDEGSAAFIQGVTLAGCSRPQKGLALPCPCRPAPAPQCPAPTACGAWHSA